RSASSCTTWASRSAAGRTARLEAATNEMAVAWNLGAGQAHPARGRALHGRVRIPDRARHRPGHCPRELHPGRCALVAGRLPQRSLLARPQRRLSRRQVMDLDTLGKQLLTTLAFTSLGLVIFGLAFWIMEKLAPFSLRKEIEED